MQFDNFMEEFSNILQRQTAGSAASSGQATGFGGD
jgi:hypothetical protein